MGCGGIGVVGTIGGTEAKRYLDIALPQYKDDSLNVVVQSFVHKLVKSGMITKAINCGNISRLQKRIEEREQSLYPVETSSIIEDLI